MISLSSLLDGSFSAIGAGGAGSGAGLSFLSAAPPTPTPPFGAPGFPSINATTTTAAVGGGSPLAQQQQQRQRLGGGGGGAGLPVVGAPGTSQSIASYLTVNVGCTTPLHQLLAVAQSHPQSHSHSTVLTGYLSSLDPHAFPIHISRAGAAAPFLRRPWPGLRHWSWGPGHGNARGHRLDRHLRRRRRRRRWRRGHPLFVSNGWGPYPSVTPPHTGGPFALHGGVALRRCLFVWILDLDLDLIAMDHVPPTLCGQALTAISAQLPIAASNLMIVPPSNSEATALSRPF